MSATNMTVRARMAGLALSALLVAGCETIPDAPERGRHVTWSGYTWAVKDQPNPVGPGPNRFSGRADDIYVDAEGRLHLKIVKRNGHWMSTELAPFDSLGYGTYAFEVEPGATRIPGNAVLGLFTYDGEPEDQHREIDIEVSRWNDGRAENLQCALQPAETPGYVHKVPMHESANGWILSFRWAPGIVDCHFAERLLGGTAGRVISTHRLTKGFPRPGNEKVRLNLWLYKGSPPDTNAPAEVVVRSFRFTPLEP